LETREFIRVALHVAHSKIGALKNPPDGLMISLLDLCVLSCEPLNEIEYAFSPNNVVFLSIVVWRGLLFEQRGN
jgi:hypothetical protein